MDILQASQPCNFLSTHLVESFPRTIFSSITSKDNLNQCICSERRVEGGKRKRTTHHIMPTKLHSLQCGPPRKAYCETIVTERRDREERSTLLNLVE